MQNKKKTSCWFSCNNNLLPAVAFFYFSLSWWIRKKNKIKAGSIARPFSTHLHLFPGSELASRVKSLPLLVLRPHLPLSRIHKSYIPASNRRQQSFQSYGERKRIQNKRMMNGYRRIYIDLGLGWFLQLWRIVFLLIRFVILIQRP